MIKITFSNNTYVTLNENDVISEVCLGSNDTNTFATSGKVFSLEQHHHLGLVPDIMSAILQCDFFMIETKSHNVYNANQIVSVEEN